VAASDNVQEWLALPRPCAFEAARSCPSTLVRGVPFVEPGGQYWDIGPSRSAILPSALANLSRNDQTPNFIAALRIFLL
jgi:hypothetical protein